MRPLPALFLAVLCPILGCQSQRPSAATPPSASYPVIVRLVSVHHTITITAGPNGPLYSARDRDGTVLASNLTLGELRAQRPDIYRQVNPALASAAASPDSSVMISSGR